jgi:hypothetical protein
LRKLAIAFLIVASLLALTRQAQALQATLATKQITVNVTITPSPIVYVPESQPARTVAAASHYAEAHGAAFARAFAAAQTDERLAYDPFNLGDMVAQATPQGSVKVNFTVKVDPTFGFFHLTPVNTNLQAGYGPNTFTCVYQVFGSYPRAWNIDDYAYGSNTSGGAAGLNGFPLYNYSRASDLEWLGETVTTSYKAFANSGAPGELAVSGAAGQSKTICIDLSLNVPDTIPAQSYQATISYRMIHS